VSSALIGDDLLNVMSKRLEGRDDVLTALGPLHDPVEGLTNSIECRIFLWSNRNMFQRIAEPLRLAGDGFDQTLNFLRLSE
jgi:hypothetical protein